MCMCEQWWLHCTSQWGQWMPLSEHVYCVAITFKMTQRVEQQICIKFCMKLEHSSAETIWMIEKATAKGTWWLAASSQQNTHSCIISRVEFFGETSNHQGDWGPLWPRFGALWLLAFPKTKITFEREEISDHWWDSGKHGGQPIEIGRTVWVPKVPALTGTEVSLSYVNVSRILYLLQ